MDTLPGTITVPDTAPTREIIPEPDWRGELDAFICLMATEVSSPAVSAEWNRLRRLLMDNPPNSKRG